MYFLASLFLAFMAGIAGMIVGVVVAGELMDVLGISDAVNSVFIVPSTGAVVGTVAAIFTYRRLSGARQD